MQPWQIIPFDKCGHALYPAALTFQMNGFACTIMLYEVINLTKFLDHARKTTQKHYVQYLLHVYVLQRRSDSLI